MKILKLATDTADVVKVQEYLFQPALETVVELSAQVVTGLEVDQPACKNVKLLEEALSTRAKKLKV